MRTECAFCKALTDRSSQRPIYNRHLFSFDSFVVMPAVGPIVPGHVMVVGREHVASLARLDPSVISEYEGVVTALRRRLPIGVNGLLEAEHGATDEDPGGTCITHTHINVMPGLQDQLDLFVGKLPELVVGPGLLTIASVRKPYVFLKAGNAMRLYDARDIPSQLIRRELCARLGRDDWDWAAFPHLDRVEETVRYWTPELVND